MAHRNVANHLLQKALTHNLFLLNVNQQPDTMKTIMKFKASYFLLPILIGLFGYMLFSVYGEVKEKSIEEFNKQQMILAEQAAKGIERFFTRLHRDLSYLSNLDAVVSLNDQGKKLMRDFYNPRVKEFQAVTRLDATGKITYTIPIDPELIGKDISSQEHIRTILQTHEPVVSDVFEAVQGYRGLAYHVPVFKNQIFQGTIGVLIPFENQAKRYLENIRIGKSGYAWVLSEKGVELYCPVPGHTGNTIFKTSSKFPSVISMAREALKGQRGTTSYTYGNIRGENTQNIKKLAVFLPIHLGNTFWSIVVATPESEVLSNLTGFRNKLFLIIALLMIAWIAYSYYLIKARAILKEETKRKQVEEALRESEKKYRRLVENAVVGVYQVTREGIFRFVNEKTAEMFGFDKPEDLLEEVPNIINFYVHPLERPVVLKEMDENGFVHGREVEFKKRDGDSIWVSLSTRRVEDKGEIFYEGLIEDISERKKLEKELQQAQKMEAIGTLSGGIAHDFNNILGIILGNTELAMDDIPEWNPARRNLEEVRKACLRAKDVIQQILSFSRQSESAKKPIKIVPIVEESVKLLRASIPSSIEIRQNIKADEDTILGNSTQIHQVLINLCGNATHAMEETGGILEVNLDNVILNAQEASQYHDIGPGPYVKLTVRDTGHGMDATIIKRIFDPYFTTKDVGKGTGMGLAMVHGIVKRHGGAISVQSQPGNGASFEIIFPIIGQADADEVKMIDDLPRGHERILFVDDESSMVELNKQRLERLGYSVETRTDPVAALALFASDADAFDLVITDMTMPHMSGDALARELLKIRPDLPIILCTGYSARISEEKALELGIKKYIEKPIEMEILARSVREVLS